MSSVVLGAGARGMRSSFSMASGEEEEDEREQQKGGKGFAMSLWMYGKEF